MTNDKSNTLSKSRYCKGLSCPKILWLDAHPEVAKPTPIDAMTQGLFDMGHKVGDLAMEYFGDFVEVPFSENKEEMIAPTKVLMDKKVPVIAEASFVYEGNFCSVDILRAVEGGYELIEVKSFSFSPKGTSEDIKREKKRSIYLHDMSYQAYVLSQLGISIKKVFLMVLNKEYIFKDELDIQELFVLIDCTDEVLSMLPDVPARIEKIKKDAYQTAEPDIEVGTHCFGPYTCGFLDYCLRHLPEDNIFTVGAGMWKKKQLELYRAGIVGFPEILKEAEKGNIVLNDNQTLHVKSKVEDLPPYVDQIAIKEFLSQLRYPLYFFDFETFDQVIPEWDGVSPYSKIPFQYSLHIQKEEGAKVIHKEFLAKEGVDPRPSLVAQLCKDIPKVGNPSILAYSGFEKTNINKLAHQLPEFRDYLLWINEHIVDLAKPFKDGIYYHKDMGGSYSIKAVLPALFPDDPELDYGKLEFIQSGSDAMTIFPILHTKSPEEIALLRKALLEYCHLDTLAMVKIVEKLREVVN